MRKQGELLRKPKTKLLSLNSNFLTNTEFCCLFACAQMVRNLIQQRLWEKSVNLAYQMAFRPNPLVLLCQRDEKHNGVVKFPALTQPFLRSGLPCMFSASENEFMLRKLLSCSMTLFDRILQARSCQETGRRQHHCWCSSGSYQWSASTTGCWRVQFVNELCCTELLWKNGLNESKIAEWIQIDWTGGLRRNSGRF